MSWLEINKIFASILVAIILIFTIGYIGNLLINIESSENKKTAYIIEIPENDIVQSTSISESSKNIEPISSLLKTASLDRGEKIFKKCATCHSYKKDGASKVGPNLWNIVNSPKANVNDFNYSDAITKKGGIWSYEELGSFLYKPKDYINGTKMNFPGLKNVEDRANVVFWLTQQTDDPVPITE